MKKLLLRLALVLGILLFASILTSCDSLVWVEDYPDTYYRSTRTYYYYNRPYYHYYPRTHYYYYYYRHRSNWRQHSGYYDRSRY